MSSVSSPSSLEPVPPAIAAARTLAEIFNARAALTPTSAAYREFDSRSQGWKVWSWREVAAEVARWRAALAREGLPIGARVATLMASGVAYVSADQATLALGLAVVPLHATDNPGNLAFILQDSEASVLVIDRGEYWAHLAPEVASILSLKRIVIVSDEAADHEADSRAVRASDWLAAAAGDWVSDATVSPEMLSAIVYTSGTTGRPKGVMLSHANVVSNVLALLQRVAPLPEDVFLSFLPLSHTFERTTGYYLPIATGSLVAYARSIALLSEDLVSVRPTILISVPRIYERFYAAIQERLVRGGPLSRKMFDQTLAMGWRRFQASHSPAPADPSFVERLTLPALDNLVAAKIRARFGGRLRVAVAGGAPMPETVSRCFLAMGIVVLQGYGMTETSPVVSVNRLERNYPTTVGEPLEGVEVKIGESDELLVRGPNVMMGYWRRPEETARVLERDGWLHSGDQAVIRDGLITIKGRIKDIIVTSTGEKISPADLEQAIAADPLVEQIMVIGEQRPFIVALAVLNRTGLDAAVKQLGLADSPDKSLGAEAMRAYVLQRIAHAAADFPSYATPRKVWLTLEPWTVGAGLMTPTLKLKRQAIERAFAGEIERLYAK